MPDLINLSATQLIDLQKNNKVSAQEIAESFINRYEKVEKKVQAWEFFDKELFLQKSIEADDYRKSGKDLGALHGLPIGIKDIFGTDDMPTRCGTDIRKGLQTTKESEVASLLTNAGSIIMGKTVTTEFAYFDPGKTKNPHDYERTPGGSSSGSAAAVAAGMVPVAIGSQTNGSVIRPASYCGVYGYKPTFGLISRRGVLKQSYLLDHVGIISKCIDDLALISKEIIKKDIDDISTVHFPVTNILNISKEEPPFEPKFIFYKTSKWKNMDKDAIKSFEAIIFIGSCRNN
jgi:Asp-tRNA(Asn)/Glu-tRNA(Gln) amidotransferase A subunit family amidase